MIVRTLSGIPQRKMKPIRRSYAEKLQNALTRVNPGSFAAHLIRNEIYRLNGMAKRTSGPVVPSYKQFLEEKAKHYKPNGLVYSLIQKELQMIGSSDFTGNVAFPINGLGLFKKLRKKIGKGVKNVFTEAGKVGKKAFSFSKKINLAPSRNAFLLLVKVNARGLATALYHIDRSKVEKMWKRFGGNPKKLYSVINSSARKKPLLGSNQQPIAARAVSNINGDGIGFSLAAALAAAAPILAGFAALINALPKKDKNKMGPFLPGEEPGSDKTTLEKLADLATSFGGNSSLPADFVATKEDGAPDDAGEPTGDDDVDKSASGFKISPAVLLGAGGLAYILLTSKKTR